MAYVDFCGETFTLSEDQSFLIGREGDLSLNDNPYLHRVFLTLGWRDGLWWLNNVGSRIPATVSDPAGRLQAWIAPEANIPLVFARTIVRFTAGPTVYEFEIVIDEPRFSPAVTPTPMLDGATLGADTADFTPDQFKVIVVLAEPSLRGGGWGQSALPTSEQAARRLGWGLTKFNRKLDNVCDKLAKTGVKGLHGGPGRLASGRRARLVEYALAARFVTEADLALLNP